jgi:microcystin-dependent protein
MSEFFGQEIQVLVVSVPVGTMVEYGGDTAPNDWMLCEGQALDRSTYAALFAVLGTKFGSGDGSGAQFNIPDCRDKVTVGKSTTRPVGATGGVEAVALGVSHMPAHDHGAAGDHAHSAWTGTAGNHAHSHGEHVSGRANIALGGVGMMFDTNQYGINGYRDNIAAAGDHAHAVGIGNAGTHTHAAVGGGAAHENMQPFVVCTKIIKVV